MIEAPQTEAMTPLAAALRYALRGWHVFPCEGKLPDSRLAPQGFQNSSTSDVMIRAWWKANPDANIGVACGKRSGIFVVDVDPEEGGDAALAALENEHGALPVTPRARTGGGGLHVFFAHPRGGQLGNSAGRLGPGVDTRGEGGYVVVAPSVHPKTGEPYKWLDGCGPADLDLAPVPDWLFGLLVDRPEPRPAAPVVVTFRDSTDAYGRRALEDELADLARTREGGRDHQLNSAAFSLGQLVGGGVLAEGEVVAALEQTARGIGLSDREIVRTIESGLTAGKADPRGIPASRFTDKTDKTSRSAGFVSFVSHSGPAENEDWPAPDPMEGPPPAPRLPLELLPREVAEVASDVADRQQSAPDFVAWPLVVSAAALVGRQVGIRPLRLDDWTEQPAIWAALVGRPSTLKTPALHEGTRPLRRQQAKESERHDQAVADWLSACADLRRANPKIKDHDLPSKPTLVRCFTSDVTVEKLATMLVPDVSRGLAVVRDELAGLVLDMNKYAKGGDRQFWLQAYTGSAYVVDRLSRESVFVPDLLVSLVGGVQPAVAATVFGTGADDGFAARVTAIWPDEPATFAHAERVPNKAARDALDQVNDVLATASWFKELHRDDFGPVPFCRLDPDGLTIFAEWRSRFLTDLRASQYDDRLAARLGKYPGLVARLVLLFHLHEWAAGRVPQARLVTAETVARVLDLVATYLRPMDERVYARFAVPPAADSGRRVATWLTRNRPSSITVREVQRHGWSGLTSAQEVAAALEWLVVHGWLREAEPDARPGRPSARFLVNPRIPEKLGG